MTEQKRTHQCLVRICSEEKLAWTCLDRIPSIDMCLYCSDYYIQINLSCLDAEDGQRFHGVVMRHCRRRIHCRRFMTMLLVERAAKRMTEQVDVVVAFPVSLLRD